MNDTEDVNDIFDRRFGSVRLTAREIELLKAAIRATLAEFEWASWTTDDLPLYRRVSDR